MKRKKVNKLFLMMGLVALLTNVKSYATEEIASDTTLPEENNMADTVLVEEDVVPPVFDSNIQTRYVLRRDDTGKEFIPEEWIKDVKATDDVDGEDVDIALEYNGVDLARDGEYYVSYTATDKSGNESWLGITVIVDGTGPIFSDETENLYYLNKDGILLDSNFAPVDALPETITATDSLGAFAGIGVCMIEDEEGNIVFCSTIANTPAEEVIQPNDILLEVDGEDVRGKTTAYVSTKVKGTEGTDVTLKLLRNEEEITLTITRGIVKLYEDEEILAKPTVEIESIDRKADGVIEITYIATDEAGNTTEFVVRVVVDETAPMLYVDGKKLDENEAYMTVVTTSDTPPSDYELPVVTATDYDYIKDEEVPVADESIVVEGLENKDEFEIREAPYKLVYKVKDALGNEKEYTIYVKIVDKTSMPEELDEEKDATTEMQDEETASLKTEQIDEEAEKQDINESENKQEDVEEEIEDDKQVEETEVDENVEVE